MPEQRPVPASECRRSGSRVVGRECGGWRVEGGLGGVGCIKVAAGVLLGSQPSASLAATARPQSSSRGADVDRSAVFEAPLLRAALTSSGLETLQGTVESCNAHRQVCAGLCLVSSISRSGGRVGPEQEAGGMLQSAASGLQVQVQQVGAWALSQRRAENFNGRPKKKVAVSDSGWYFAPKQESGACWRDGIDGTAGQGSRGVLRMKGVVCREDAWQSVVFQRPDLGWR